MADIRKKTGSRGIKYQVRFPTKGTKTGYAYQSFKTLKEARHFAQNELPKLQNSRHEKIRSVNQAIDKWLDVCEHEGRDGQDPVSKSTFSFYTYLAAIMKVYGWEKELHKLEAPDIVQFRSWLLKNYSRYLSQRVLSAFHSVLLEMVTQGVLQTDPASGISVQQSRYKEPVKIPSIEEMQKILRAADELATDKNYWIARAWQRYRPMVYLAADSGMRPQEYLVLRTSDLRDKGVQISQALDGSNEIGPPKSTAGRRYIPVGPDTMKMAKHFIGSHQGPNPDMLLFPGEGGQHQRYNNFLRRCWYILMEKAGMMVTTEKDGKKVTEVMYTPYSLRHFFASMLISNNKDLKTLQEWMGHKDAAMTLNVYGHLIRLKNAERSQEHPGVLSGVLGTITEFSSN